MAFPERIVKGATVIIDGECRRRDGRPFDLSGYRVFLTLAGGGGRWVVEGAVLDAPRGKFQVTLGRELTSALPLGTLGYEVYVENENNTYVLEQGKTDVRPRL